VRTLIFLLLLAFPLLGFGFIVNSVVRRPSTRHYVASRCTRYCYFHACPHATATNSPAYFQLRPLYNATIKGLAAGGKKWYVTANILFYLVFMPLLLFWLVSGIVRSQDLISQLQSRLRHA